MNKTYKKPSVKVRHIDGELMVQASVLDPNKENQSIVVSDEEYNGEFAAPKTKSIWDE